MAAPSALQPAQNSPAGSDFRLSPWPQNTHQSCYKQIQKYNCFSCLQFWKLLYHREGSHKTKGQNQRIYMLCHTVGVCFLGLLVHWIPSRKIPSACCQLLQILSDLHISLQLSPVLVWNCCLAFWAVFPVAREPACREDLESSHSKKQWGIRKGRRGETAVHSPE